MTEDEVLIERIRPILRRRKGFSEKRMFGGVCFMINGNMCAGTWKGALIVRLARENHEATLAEPHTKPADMAGRVMKGWALGGTGGDCEPKTILKTGCAGRRSSRARFHPSERNALFV